MMLAMRLPGLGNRALLSSLKSYRNNDSVHVNRQMSILAFSRRHPLPRLLARPHRSCTIITASPRYFSSHTDILATASASHVPVESIPWYNPAQHIMDVAHMIHDTTGSPYALCIVFITAMGRMALFPLMISSQRVRIKRGDIQDALKRFSKTKPTKQALLAKRNALRKQYGYHPSQHFTLPLSSLALTCYMWFGLRWMGYYYPDELSTGGLLWFTDLTQSDPLYLLPILSGTSSILMFEVGTDFKEMSDRRKLFGRVISVTIIPILMFAPASVHIFWTSNWLMSAVQDVVISQPYVRDKLGLLKASEREDNSIVFIKDVQRDDSNEEVVEAVVVKPKGKRGSKQNKKRPARR